MRYSRIYRTMMNMGLMFAFFLIISSFVHSQNAVVSASLDSSSIKVGQQVMLRLSAEQDDKTILIWPVFSSHLSKEIEIVRQEKIDTTFSQDKRSIYYNQNLIITSFDSGVFTIPPFRFQYISYNDTFSVFTDSLQLFSATLPVDTLKGFHDITGPVDPPFGWDEIIGYIFIAFAILIAALLIYFYIQKRKNRKKHEPLSPQQPLIPAHVIALQSLQNLLEHKYWQKGEVKKYYSELTDIIRIYLHNRFDIDAIEMTTAEILHDVSFFHIHSDSIHSLSRLLSIADLVKFAKYLPDTHEHEHAYQKALSFVEQTADKSDQHDEINS